MFSLLYICDTTKKLVHFFFFLRIDAVVSGQVNFIKL